CIIYCGGTPIFSDIDSKTYNIAPQEMEKKINQKK
ncbi:MAG: DegT/DnrJ/EryC1/StrS family aminotransferase, partial [Chloroflexi bacterium]|nr:DegT/DnrJ/EryC1/StrS family aminotransferase [Chloroflexota bacterium]